MTDADAPHSPSAGAGFVTTRWSVVARAGESPGEGSRAAMATLCETYWQPVFEVVRRRGGGLEEAQDLTQEFFARLIQRNDLAAADAERGRFRSFLLGCLRHFLSDRRRHDGALKRGGGRSAVPLDPDRHHDPVLFGPAREEDPELVFERSWALTLLELVIGKLGEEYRAAGKDELFEALRPHLGDERGGEPDGESHREIALRLKRTEGAIRVAAHRLRERFGQVLRREIVDTLEHPEDVEDEVRALFRTLAR